MRGLNQVSLLVACRDKKNVIRVANDVKLLPGVHTKVDGSRPITPQIRQIWSEFMGQADYAQHVRILSAVEPLLQLDQAETSCLFVLAMPLEHFCAPESWQTLPEMLRALPGGRNRVAYNKAFQILAGALSEEYCAIEVDELVQNRLQEILKSDQH